MISPNKRSIVEIEAIRSRETCPRLPGEPEKEYFCPILVTCPHWLDKCHDNGCQHPEAIKMREGK
jgi:hypothetical protein